MKKYIFIVLAIIIALGVWFVATQTDYANDDAKLVGTDWQWQETTNPDGSITTANDPTRFVLRFGSDGTFSSSTDCNSLSGIYSKNGEVLSVGQIISTKMFCEGSQESDYVRALSMAGSHTIEGDTLTIILTRDAGTMTFRTK